MRAKPRWGKNAIVILSFKSLEQLLIECLKFFIQKRQLLSVFVFENLQFLIQIIFNNTIKFYTTCKSYRIRRDILIGNWGSSIFYIHLHVTITVFVQLFDGCGGLKGSFHEYEIEVGFWGMRERAKKREETGLTVLRGFHELLAVTRDWICEEKDLKKKRACKIVWIFDEFRRWIQ